MTKYICHRCNIEITIKNRDSGSAFAEKCPSCLKEDELEYL